MKYPMIANYLLFEENQDGTYTIIDRLKYSAFEVSQEVAAFAVQLDGKTSPLSIVRRMNCGLNGTDAYKMLDFLEELGTIRHNRILKKSFGTVYYSLFIVRHHTDKFKKGARVLNFFLKILWLPVLLFGLFSYITGSYTNVQTLLAILGGCVSLIVGGSLHELSHAGACHGFGGTVFEFGVHIDHFLPGVYTFIDYSNITDIKKLIRIIASGIEMDFLLSGIFLFLASQIEAISSFAFGFALINSISGMSNCLFLGGSDGTKILECLLETDDIFIRARKIIHSKQLKHRLRKNRFIGRITIVFCYTITMLHFFAPALAIVIMVWGCFLIS